MNSVLTLRVSKYSSIIVGAFLRHVVGTQGRYIHTSAAEAWMLKRTIETNKIAEEYFSPFYKVIVAI